jgi:hypothetical protein
LFEIANLIDDPGVVLNDSHLCFKEPSGPPVVLLFGSEAHLSFPQGNLQAIPGSTRSFHGSFHSLKLPCALDSLLVGSVLFGRNRVFASAVSVWISDLEHKQYGGMGCVWSVLYEGEGVDVCVCVEKRGGSR